MIALVRRDPAIRSLPRWLFLAPVLSNAMDGLRTMWVLRHPALHGGVLGLSSTALALALWLPLVGYLLFGRVTQRCTHMDLGLPLSARRLWRAHIAGALLASLAVVAAELLLFGLSHAFLVRFAPGRSGAVAALQPMLLPFLATLTAALAIIQMPSPGALTVHQKGTRWLLALVLVPGGPVFILVLASLPAWTSLLVMACALTVLVLLEQVVPAAFTLVPLAAAAGTAGDLRATGERAAPPRSRTGFPAAVRREWVILRVMAGGVAPGQIIQLPMVLLGVPMIIAWGILLSGFFIGQKVGVLFLTLSAYLLFAFVPALLAQVHILDPLPVSRRHLFASAVFPGLLLLSLGYGLGIAAQELRPPAPAVEYQAARSRLYPEIETDQPALRVPMVACRITWMGNVPILTSPWGEAHPAWSQPILKGGRLKFYSPYWTSETASPRFVALQISRAIEGVYGVAIPPGDIRRRYLDPDTPESGSLESGRNSLHADFPQLGAPVQAPQAPVFLTITGLLLLAMIALYSRALRATVSNRGRKVAMFSLLGALFVLQAIELALGVMGLLDIDLAAGAAQIGAISLAAVVPGGAFSLWVGGGMLFWGAYLLAERYFQRVEAPVGPFCRGTGDLI